MIEFKTYVRKNKSKGQKKTNMPIASSSSKGQKKTIDKRKAG